MRSNRFDCHPPASALTGHVCTMIYLFTALHSIDESFSFPASLRFSKTAFSYRCHPPSSRHNASWIRHAGRRMRPLHRVVRRYALHDNAIHFSRQPTTFNGTAWRTGNELVCLLGRPAPVIVDHEGYLPCRLWRGKWRTGRRWRTCGLSHCLIRVENHLSFSVLSWRPPAVDIDQTEWRCIPAGTVGWRCITCFWRLPVNKRRCKPELFVLLDGENGAVQRPWPAQA